MNQSQNLTNSENKTQPEQNTNTQNETKSPIKSDVKVCTTEIKENKENLSPNESKENKQQSMNVENKNITDINTNMPDIEKKEEIKTENKGININASLLNSINQNNHEYIVDPRIQKKKNIKKEIYIIHAIQNYIIRNSFQKMVKAVLQIDDIDFDENIKNEKFLRLVREKLGPEKLLLLMIKSERGLQKFFIKTRKPRRDPHKSAMTYINRLNNMNNNSMDMTSSYYTNTYNTYSSNANTNYSSNMTNGISSMNNTYNFFKDNSMSYKPREQRPQQEDLSKEIKDLMNNKNAQKQNSTTKTDDINNTSNTNGTTPNGEGGKNSKNTTPSKKSK
jgi:hypothetical protein